MTTIGDESILEFSDVVSAELYFEEDGVFKSKTRPVLILSMKDSQIICLSITSKYESKSDYVKLQYYEIHDLMQAGLRVASWIDVDSYRVISKDTANLQKNGSLSAADQQGMNEFASSLSARRQAYVEQHHNN